MQGNVGRKRQGRRLRFLVARVKKDEETGLDAFGLVGDNRP